MPLLIVQFTKCSGIWPLIEASKCIANTRWMLSEVQSAVGIASRARVSTLSAPPPGSLASDCRTEQYKVRRTLFRSAGTTRGIRALGKAGIKVGGCVVLVTLRHISVSVFLPTGSVVPPNVSLHASAVNCISALLEIYLCSCHGVMKWILLDFQARLQHNYFSEVLKKKKKNLGASLPPCPRPMLGAPPPMWSWGCNRILACSSPAGQLNSDHKEEKQFYSSAHSWFSALMNLEEILGHNIDG